MRIDQILANLDYGDAISNHALEIQRLLKSRGHISEIFVQHSAPQMKDLCRNFLKHKEVSAKDNVIIFHYSIGSEVSQYVSGAPDKKIMIYHNITPYRFFKGFNSDLYSLTINGRRELESFRDVPLLSIADSEYNADELEKLDFKNVRTIPIMIDLERFNQRPDPAVLKRLDDEFTHIIFVGRLVPNKKFEDLIKAYHFYKKYSDSRSRLLLVGSYAGMEAYLKSLRNLIRELSLNDVIFTGCVTHEELIAYYQMSDIFLCMSEHEGFCIPLLEAMHFQLPVIAFKSTGVPYTLGGAGVLVEEKSPEETAELISYIQSHPTIKDAIISKQLKRLRDFDMTQTEKRMLETIDEIAGM